MPPTPDPNHNLTPPTPAPYVPDRPASSVSPTGPVPEGPPPQSDASPYDFFLNPTQPAKKPLLPKAIPDLGPGFGFTKIILIAATVFVVLGIVAVILSSTRSKSGTAPSFVSVVAQQQEIIRVSGLGGLLVTTDSLKNFTVTTSATTTSAQTELTDYLAHHGVKIGKAELASAKNSKIDQILSAAQAASTYDASYKSTMQFLLTSYLAKLRQADSTATLESQRMIIAKDAAAAVLLQQMLNS